MIIVWVLAGFGCHLSCMRIISLHRRFGKRGHCSNPSSVTHQKLQTGDEEAGLSGENGNMQFVAGGEEIGKVCLRPWEALTWRCSPIRQMKMHMN